MQIFEEYCKRHSFRVPFVKHASLGFLICRESGKEGFDWTLLTTHWNEPDGHPGTYDIQFVRPVHDSKNLKNGVNIGLKWWAFEERTSKKLVLWDEYEDYFYNWSKLADKKIIVSGHREVLLTFWEMFVYSNDTYFARSFRNISDVLFHSLDFTASIASRYQSYLAFMKEVHNIEVFDNWKFNSNKLIRNYSNWLVDLVQRNDG